LGSETRQPVDGSSTTVDPVNQKPRTVVTGEPHGCQTSPSLAKPPRQAVLTRQGGSGIEEAITGSLEAITGGLEVITESLENLKP
jgi:hypothetical protein